MLSFALSLVLLHRYVQKTKKEATDLETAKKERNRIREERRREQVCFPQAAPAIFERPFSLMIIVMIVVVGAIILIIISSSSSSNPAVVIVAGPVLIPGL